MKLLNISDLCLPRLIKKKDSFIEIFHLRKTLLIFTFIFISLIFFLTESFAEPAVKKESKSINWFWVFYEYAEYSDKLTSVYRPFYMEAADKENLFQASLMPLFFWRYKNERNDVTKAFFGFYESIEYKHTDQNIDYDNGFFPLFFYGNGIKASDKYLFIYPAGGNIRGKLGYERISPYIFPGAALFFVFPPSGIFTLQTLFFTLASLIPVYTEFENKDYNGTAFFWPFIAWGNGDKREDFRILPFYAHNSKAGWYDNYQYLLLINYRELYLRNDEKYTFFFFPFFGKKWSKSGRMNSYTILWPFFSWGYDLDKNEKSYNLPWPLVQIAHSDKPEMNKRIFFPFWGEYKTSTYESMFATPLYFRIKNNSDYFKSEYHIISIIAWYFKRDYSYTHEYYGKSWRYFKLWPLVQAEWSNSGLYSVNVLSLFPFRDTDGYEKLYQPLWTLFEYRVKPDGETHLGFLLRTYYQVWNDDFFKMKIPVLINYESRKETLKEFTVLFSSFGYEKNRNGAYLKLLWIPLRIGDGEEIYSDNNSVDGGRSYSYNRGWIHGFNSCHGNFVETGLEDKFYFKMDFKLL